MTSLEEEIYHENYDMHEINFRFVCDLCEQTVKHGYGNTVVWYCDKCNERK